MKAIFRIVSYTICVCISVATISGHAQELPGKPIARALPAYCQNGECTIVTIEMIDPIMFNPKGALFRVKNENWYYGATVKKETRGSDTTSYIFCSKELPTVIYETDGGRFMLDFLTPNDSETYSHATSSSLEMYFAVCHARIFEDAILLTGAAEFAQALDYKAVRRDDQPLVDRPEQIVGFLGK